jgi:microcystin-dependent protein
MYSVYAKFQLVLVVLFCCLTTFGQVGIGTTTPDANAILTVTSTTKGVLLPRLTAAQQTTLAGTLTSGEAGMMIADATSGNILGWNGHAFVPAANVTAVAPLTVSATNQVALNAGTAAGQLITWDGTNWVNMAPAVQHFSFTGDNRQPWLALNYCIAWSGVFPSRNDANPYVSQIQLFPFNFAPVGWYQCDGQLLAITSYTALFSLLGTNYGGNGTSTFMLPNMQSRVSIGAGQGPGLSNFVQGQSGGTESNTISQ